MRRRTVVLGGAASAMLAAAGLRAQQPGKHYRVGILMAPYGLAVQQHVGVVREQLAKSGFVEGRNLSIDVRHPPGFGQAAAASAALQLTALQPDALLSVATTPTRAAMSVATDIPVVFANVGDPLGSGLVKDLARPGGNVTGASTRHFELTTKRLELVRELLPGAKRVAAVAVYFDAFAETVMQAAQGAADRLGFELVRVTSAGQWGGIVASSLKTGADAAVMLLSAFAPYATSLAVEEVVRGSIEARFPIVLAEVEAVENGALVSYSTRFSDELCRGADMLVRVLRGEKPGDIPVDQAAQFVLAVNLKTARAIGLKVPQSLLVRADRVVE